MKVRVTYAAFLFCLLAAASAFAQGPLTPPGAPAPTMKTLQQVEPRTPITNIPITISVPGSYYLTDHVFYFGTGAAIRVASSEVDIDLNGFTLAGLPTVTESLISQTFPSTLHSISIRNGKLRDVDTPINFPNASQVRVEKVSIYNSRLNGMELGEAATVSDCQIMFAGSLPGFHGIVVGPRSRVRNTSALRSVSAGINAGPQSIIESCVLARNGANGLSAGASTVVRDSVISSNTASGISGGHSLQVVGCVLSDNGGDGIVAQNGSRVESCVVQSNQSAGINLGNAALVLNNTVVGNGKYGIYVENGGTVRGNLVRANGWAGIRIAGGNTVSENTIDANGAVSAEGGIRVLLTSNRIDANQLTFNHNKGVWLDTTSAGNTVYKNSIKGHAFNIQNDGAGNDIGPVGTAAAGVSPWANNIF